MAPCVAPQLLIATDSCQLLNFQSAEYSVSTEPITVKDRCRQLNAVLESRASESTCQDHAAADLILNMSFVLPQNVLLVALVMPCPLSFLPGSGSVGQECFEHGAHGIDVSICPCRWRR